MTPLPNLSLIAALADNRVIGRDNRLPWHLPADLAHFKRLTMGKPIIMGRRTWESLPGLLPHRTHIIVTRNRDYRAEGGFVVHSLQEAIGFAGDAEEMLVVGGANLYAQAIPLASRMYLTFIHQQFEGDAVFPEFGRDDWCETARERHEPDDRNPFPYSFVTLVRCDVDRGC
jgi:dihydrofolate reductase